jgi:hypothetical protein
MEVVGGGLRRYSGQTEPAGDKSGWERVKVRLGGRKTGRAEVRDAGTHSKNKGGDGVNGDDDGDGDGDGKGEWNARRRDGDGDGDGDGKNEAGGRGELFSRIGLV